MGTAAMARAGRAMASKKAFKPVKQASSAPKLDMAGSPTRERWEKAHGDVDRGDYGIFTMRDAPLERALNRGTLTREQYNAGSKYRHHWYHAGLADNLVSVDLNRIFAADVGGFSGMARTEAQVFHRQRYREGVQAAGKIGSGVLDWVVCREVPLEDVGYTLGWGSKPQATAAATERLRMALDDLRKLWGI